MHFSLHESCFPDIIISRLFIISGFSNVVDREFCVHLMTFEVYFPTFYWQDSHWLEQDWIFHLEYYSHGHMRGIYLMRGHPHTIMVARLLHNHHCFAGLWICTSLWAWIGCGIALRACGVCGTPPVDDYWYLTFDLGLSPECLFLLTLWGSLLLISTFTNKLSGRLTFFLHLFSTLIAHSFFIGIKLSFSLFWLVQWDITRWRKIWCF